jgi:hypothetical protein
MLGLNAPALQAGSSLKIAVQAIFYGQPYCRPLGFIAFKNRLPALEKTYHDT